MPTIPQPNLFIIGAQKSGTSSLFNYITTHPDIFPAVDKEPQYFNTPDPGQSRLSKYLTNYREAKAERFRCEASPHYTMRPRWEGTAERIKAFSPDAYLIYIVRDPFSRLVSQYQHNVRYHQEDRTPDECVRTDPSFILKSHYAYQLQPYLELFPREHIHIETFERMITDPAAACRRVFQFLGIDIEFVPPNIGERANATPKAIDHLDRSKLTYRIVKSLKNVDLVRRLTPRAWQSKLREALPKSRSTDFRSDEFRQPIEALRPMLLPVLAHFAAEFQQMVQIDLSDWPTMQAQPSLTNIDQLPVEVQDVTRNAIV